MRRGIGELIELRVYFQSKAHPGYPYDAALHSWVACANNVTSGAPDYFWYEVAACASGAKDANATFHECLAEVPPAAVQPVRDCIADDGRAEALVAEMHKIGDSYGDFPTVLLNGKTSPSVPEPDMHGDKVGPLLKEVCRLSQGAKKPLPAACAQQAA